MDRLTSCAKSFTPTLNTSKPTNPPSPGCWPTSHRTHALAEGLLMVSHRLASWATSLDADWYVDVSGGWDRMSFLRTRMEAATIESENTKRV